MAPSLDALQDALHQAEDLNGVWGVLGYGLVIVVLVWLWLNWQDWRHLK